jgi:hypothetical protein
MTVEVIFNAPDLATLIAAATQMGYVSLDAQGHPHITATGNIATGGAYFLNMVGTVYQPTGATTTDSFGNVVPVMAALPGIWGRLRHNGDPAAMPQLPANSGITLYRYSATLGGWTADGTTLAPAYVANIGVIA